MDGNCIRDNYDFSDAVKNPFAGKIKGKYTVIIHYDFTEKSKSLERMNENDLSLDEFTIFEKYSKIKALNV